MAIRLFGEPRLDTRSKQFIVRYMGMDMNAHQIAVPLPHMRDGADFYHTTDHAADALEALAAKLREL